MTDITDSDIPRTTVRFIRSRNVTLETMRIRHSCIRKFIQKTFIFALVFVSARLLWMSFHGSQDTTVVEMTVVDEGTIYRQTIAANKSDWLLNFDKIKNRLKSNYGENTSLHGVKSNISKTTSNSVNTLEKEINPIRNEVRSSKKSYKMGDLKKKDTSVKPIVSPNIAPVTINNSHKPSVLETVIRKPNTTYSDNKTYDQTESAIQSPVNNGRVNGESQTTQTVKGTAGYLVKTKIIEKNNGHSTVQEEDIKRNTSISNVTINDTSKASVQTKSKLSVIGSALEIDSKESLMTLFKTEGLQGTCDLVPAWGQDYHARASTYDLLETVLYTTDKSGAYPIPIRTFEEIEKNDKIKNNTEILNVTLVPFSHADPGYGLTIEQYYSSMTHSTLNLMVEKLFQYPKMTFQWAETVFLSRWFEDSNEDTKRKVRELIDRGQLEIVLGGWVMPDEASTTVVGVVDQLIEGHQWLKEHLGVVPKSAWVNDPFGYSSTMPYLWKSTGMDNMMFLRINQPLKAKLMEMKSLEFLWRPYWQLNNSSDILASLMPYTNYWLRDVCGPDPNICSKFNYLHLDDPKENAIRVTDENVAELAAELYRQFRITGDLFKYNNLYIGIGEDFSFRKAKEWDDIYVNFEKLINYINSRTDWNMRIKFGTLSEYFTNVRENERQRTELAEKEQICSEAFPTLSGDFFPYTDRKKEFWTGYYTTRPLNKRFSREIESLIRAADIFNVIVHSVFKYYRVTYKASRDISKALRLARRELGMFMHHDGITGTSVPHVVRDFESRLFKANIKAHSALKMILVSLLSRGKLHEDKLLIEEISKPEMRRIAEKRVFDTSKVVKLVLLNPQSKRRREVINLHVTSESFTISSPTKYDIAHQFTKEASTGQSVNVVSFEIELPALGIEVYTLKPVKHVPPAYHVEEQVSDGLNTIMIENNHMKAEFDKITGVLERVIYRDGNVMNISSDFRLWQSVNAGAYILTPSANSLPFSTGRKVVTVTKGFYMSEVKVASPGFLQTVRIYNTSGIQGQGLHVHTEVDMAAVGMKNMDILLSIQTDMQSQQNFFTDQNNFQLMGRKNHLEPISAGFYPITSMIVTEDNYKRLTVHTKQPHGASSVDGFVLLMLDRHTFNDDGRGLGQGVYDNVKVNGDFIFHIEYKQQPFSQVENRYTYPTVDAVLMNDLLQNNVMIYSQVDKNTRFVTKVHPMKESEFPCDVSIIGFRNLIKENLEYSTSSLILHRRAFHCGFKTQNNQCSNVDQPLTIKSLFRKLKVNMVETSLSLLYEKQTLTLDSDIRPNKNELRAFKIQI